MNARSSKNNYPSHPDALEAIRRLGNLTAVAKHFKVGASSFREWLKREGIWEQACAARETAQSQEVPGAPEAPEDALAESVHTYLKKQKQQARLNVYAVSDGMDIPPSRVRQALDHLRERGFRVPEEDEDQGNIALQRVLPDQPDKLHKSLLEGQELTVGLVSDTHLGSKEDALPELNLAYDFFASRGVTEVWHPGDLVSGVGIYRTQHSEIKVHTYEDQVDYAEEFYPAREGITTRMIGGNHDLEGDFGKIGGDPVKAVAHRREDIDYLGPYSAHIELPGGSFAHLLHGSGGMSYAYSYKAQKLVDGYEAGRKPVILCPGHWHVAAWILQRNVNVVFPGCFEWKSTYLKRKGLSPAVGFFILNITLGDDGSLVKFLPEWHQYFEGRVSKP